jgi:capsular polysaccharide biosynthesis protein
VKTIYPETIAKRKLPVNFNDADLALFDHELQRAIPQTTLLTLKHIRVSPEGLLFKGTTILPESFAFPEHLREWKLRSVVKFFAKNYVLRRSRRVENEMLWITDYWSKGYFHWLTDALTRLYVVRDRINDVPLLLPAEFERLDYVKSSLEAFGVKRVDFIGPGEVLECQSLLMPSHTAPSGHYNEEIIRGVREVLISAYGASDQGEKIYISRRRAAKRRIVNEEEVTGVLSAFGFRTIYAEELSFAQQVQICSRAHCIVSNHGAGLTNILFMPEAGSVLELRHREDRINNCYFTLSSALNLNYFYQTCRPAEVGPDPHMANIVVDLKELEKNLQQLI